MKKYLRFLVSAVMLFTVVTPTSAHDVIPQELYYYLQANPEATNEDIHAFIAKTDGELAEKYSNDESIARLVDRQDAGTGRTILDFTQLGIEHIFGGLDHILFVLSLLLVFISLRHVLKLTLTFTIAHSITLLLAGAGIITLPVSVVEPLIALSIVVVAIVTVFFKDKPWMKNSQTILVTVFFFGLFHGLGFAGLLHEIHIPDGKFIPALISFNLGIELGQVSIVALALPFIYLGRKKPWYAQVIKIIAIGISILAVVWFIQRIIG